MTRPRFLAMSAAAFCAASLTLTPAVAVAGGNGPQHLSVLVVRIVWAGQPPSLSAAEITQALAETADWYASVSYGKITLDEVVVTEPITIAAPNGGCPYSVESRSSNAQLPNQSSYDRKIYLLPEQVSCDWAGLSGSGEVWLNGDMGSRVIEHELGHTFGLDHAWANDCWPLSDAAACNVKEYGDAYSIMGNEGRGFSAPELASLHLLTPPTLVSGASYPLRPLLQAPDALAVPTAQGTFWFANEQTPLGSDLCIPSGVVAHLDTGERFWQIAPFGVAESLLDQCGSFVPPGPFLPGAVFVVPGIFQVSSGIGTDSATLTFTWLDTSPPARPSVQKAGARSVTIAGGADNGSGLSRYEISVGGKTRSLSAANGQGYSNFRRGLAGPANVTAVDNAGNSSIPVIVRFTKTGSVRLSR